jgi:CheY-like chemotaxis protein
MADVIIFDDDPAIGDVAAEVLRGFGLTVEHHPNAAGAAQIVLESRPRLVMLDIMMPGMDGLAACRAIKGNPATGHVKVLVVTSKNFPHEEARALRYGADAFLGKPFSPEGLARKVADLLGASKSPQPAGGNPVRLTIFNEGAVLEAASARIFLDGGEETREWILRQPWREEPAWLFFGRYPAAPAAIRAGAALVERGIALSLAGPETPEGDLQLLAPGVLEQARGAAPERLPRLYPLREGEFAILPGTICAARHTRYPGIAMAYRIELGGRRIAYCPWHQFDSPSAKNHDWAKFATFFAGADVLLHGCRQDCGPWEAVADIALEGRVKRLIFLPPGSADLAAKARQRVGGALACHCAAETPTLEL